MTIEKIGSATLYLGDCREFVGIEVDREKFDMACERFYEHSRQGVLL